MIFSYIKNPMLSPGTKMFEALVEEFARKHLPNPNLSILIDCRRTRDNYSTEGLFGEFLDMYQPGTQESLPQVYLNPHHFYEVSNVWSNPGALAHIVMHELVHVAQIQRGDMVVTPDLLVWKGRAYDRAPFVYNIFVDIFQYDPALAERYHKAALPWEREAYRLPEKFMNRPLYSWFVGTKH